MPDTGITSVVNTASHLMLAMMAGDLTLRRISLRPIRTPPLLPSILAAREMRGKLSFVVRLSQSAGFLFGLFEEEREDTVADIRLRFAVRPTPDPAAVPFAGPRMMFVPPPFLEPAPDTARLRLRLYTGNLLRVAFGADQSMVLQDDSEAEFDASQEWPTRLLVALLDTMASWLRTPQAGTPRPFVIPPETLLGGLLQEVIAGFRLILDNFAGELSDQEVQALDAELTAVHAAFGAGYTLSALLARILVQLDADGDLVTDLDDPDWHQFDIDVRLVPHAATHAIHLAMHPPDFLTAGEYHRSFLAAIRSPDVVAELYVELGRPDVDERAFRDYLHDPQQDQTSLFVRIRRDDLDLVRLQGTLHGEEARLLYQMRFEVTPYPEVQVRRVTEVRLVTAEIGTQAWDGAASREAAQRYFRRFFRALRVWQRGMILGTAT